MNPKLVNAFCEQINKEYYSAYLYLAMSDWFTGKGLKGAAHWTYVQYQEELMHAQAMYHYLHARNERARLAAVADPSVEWTSIQHVFAKILDHERYVTESIGNLATLAMQVGDHAGYIFLQWFISEQVEEEGNVSEIIDKLTLAGDNPNALLLIDSQLAARTFVAPVIPGLPALI